MCLEKARKCRLVYARLYAPPSCRLSTKYALMYVYVSVSAPIFPPSLPESLSLSLSRRIFLSRHILPSLFVAVPPPPLQRPCNELLSLHHTHTHIHTFATIVPMLPAQFSAMFPNVVSAAYVAPSDPSGHIRRYCRQHATSQEVPISLVKSAAVSIFLRGFSLGIRSIFERKRVGMNKPFPWQEHMGGIPKFLQQGGFKCSRPGKRQRELYRQKATNTLSSQNPVGHSFLVSLCFEDHRSLL